MKRTRIATGAGYSNDRIEPAVEVVEKGEINYVVFECLAERTIAIAQQRKLLDPKEGYDRKLEARMRAILPKCVEKKIKIITNMGAANPKEAGNKIAEITKDLGLRQIRLAVVQGDDVFNILWNDTTRILDDGRNICEIRNAAVSANAYTGAQPIVEVLRKGANIVVTGRTADPSLFLAPMIYELDWKDDDWNLLGSGVVISHLMECGAQVTGGYFADSEKKSVPNLARLGFPIAEVYENGEAVITKAPNTGGKVTLETCKEQLLYEIHDPSAYVTPDCIADFTGVRFEEVGNDQVKVVGGRGEPRPQTLKVNIGYLDGYIGEGQISYAGAKAYERAKLAAQIAMERFQIIGLDANELRVDFIGVNSLHGPMAGEPPVPPNEVRLRVVGRTRSKEEAERIGSEVESLYTNGPSGGGGATSITKEVLAIASTTIPRECIQMDAYVRDVGE